MKILAISYLFPSNITPNYGIFVANRLSAVNKTNEVTVINPIPWFPFSHRFMRYKNYNLIPAYEKIKSLTVYHPRFFIIPRYFKFLDSFTFLLTVFFTVFKYRKRINFDIVDVHWTYPDILSGLLLGKIFNKKTILTLRGMEAFYLKEKGFRKWLIKKSLLRYDFVIGLSNELCDKALEYGLPKDKVKSIRNGVDTEQFYYIPREEACAICKINPKIFSILSVGSLIERKGFHRIIQAIAVIKNNTNIHYYIAGGSGPEGNYKKELEELIHKYELENNIHLIGALHYTDLLYWYNAVNLFVLPSLGEGSPNVLTEALACGCPSIATNVGAVPEILDTIDLGLVVNANISYIQLAGYIEQAIIKNYDRIYISNYMRHFNWDWCAKRVINVYRSIV